MKGVVLAAGDGGRLRPLTNTRSKVLLPVGGRALISYPLEALAAAGVTDIVVVVGYLADEVAAGVSRCTPPGVRVQYAVNPHYHGGNALSVAAARQLVGDDSFVLCMGDHVIDRGVVCRLLDGEPVAPVLCIDTSPTLESQTNDATRVLVNEVGHVASIGKSLSKWNAVDAGVFLLGNEVFDLIEEAQCFHGSDVEMTHVVRLLVAQGTPFATCDVHGHFWTDIDTVSDYQSAARLLEDPDGVRV